MRFFILFLALGLGACDEAPERSSAKRPNIILFLVDDMGWQDTSVAFHEETTPLNQHFRTPAMERLASNGVRFTQAYAAAVCSPTRTAIMTGQNPVRHQVTNWTLFPDRDQSGETERLRAPDGWRKEGLQPGQVTLPQLLGEAGYRTIHCGKAHWGAHGTEGSDPTKLGFDINIAGHAAGAPGHYHGEENYGNETAGSYTLPWGVPGLESYHGTETHLTDALTIEALAAIEQAVLDQRPFYLYMAHYAVHTPLQEHRPYVDHYRGQIYPGTEIPIPEVEAIYASMVAGMDASLAQILARLEELGVAEDTLVLFASDNGGLSAHARGTTPMGTGKETHNGPLKAGKGSAYEGGTRIPLIVSWARLEPGNDLQNRISIKPGSRQALPVISEDYFPTLCAWAGVEIPESYWSELDGLDFSGSLAVAGDPGMDRTLLFHYPHVWGPAGLGYEPHSAIRKGVWKAVYFYEPERWELYNLADDIGESDDLAARRPDKLGELAEAMRSEFERLGAQFPVNKETGAAELPDWP
ncbi:MAG: sulfatase [Acidobacteriota bacterium]|nr:MAG: sulfatase [Acidobacteriota bacterium]